MKHSIAPFGIVFGIALLLTVVDNATGQWTVVNLHPAGSNESIANDVEGSQQVGYATFGSKRAGNWTGTALTWASVHPASALSSESLSVNGTQLTGVAWLSNPPRAALWSSGKWTDLHSTGSYSTAFASDAGQQVGQVGMTLAGPIHAALWSGTSAWTNLNPAKASGSVARGVYAGQQVGSATVSGIEHAGYWTGTAASWTDLNPAGATGSAAYDVHAGQQVGGATISGVLRAGLWNGTAESWVDLHPNAATQSFAVRVHNGWQVGRVVIDGLSRASIWHGTAASWQNLSLTLPPGSWGASEALGVWTDQKTLHVVGYARDTVTNRQRAMLWTRTLVPCPADMNGNFNVNIDDLVAVITSWGSCQSCPPHCPGDANQDCVVNIDDLVQVITNWGPCP